MSKQYTKEQFLETTEPYDYLLSIKNDPEQHERELAAIKENASTVGIRNFGTLYKVYQEAIKGQAFHLLQGKRHIGH